MIAKFEQRNGYQKCFREDGSAFYLCDKCEKVAFACNSEHKIQSHVRWTHQK